MRSLTILVLVVAVGAPGCVFAGGSDTPELVSHRPPTEWRPVAGSGVHYFSTAIVHATEPTDVGMIQRSTESVDLTGDLEGRLLYQPISVFDFVDGTLVNTGNQVYSGMVLDVGPVLLHDDEFVFVVDLDTGATVGEVHLVDRVAGPRTKCHLEVTGTGLTPEGDATFDYVGECRVPRTRPPAD